MIKIMMKGAPKYLLVALALALGLILGMVGWAGANTPPLALAQPGTGTIRVAVSGQDMPGCGGEVAPCRTVQYAVDGALPGEEIRVAGGVYTDLNDYGGLAQVIYLSKTLTIRGGYTETNWSEPNPIANPTILDAGGQGRVLYASGAISVTAEGLYLTGGDANGLGGGSRMEDAGGGVYVYAATVTIRQCWIKGNTASATHWASGGGLYLWGGTATLSGNTVVSNTAGSTVGGFGGGLFLDKGSATLVDNVVRGNTATSGDEGFGGGLYIRLGYAELERNLIQDNAASTAWAGDGGGLYLFGSEARLDNNTIRDNIASTAWAGRGGGLHLCSSDVTLTGNTIVSNTASTAASGSGGGLSFCTTDAALEHNRVADNVASSVADGYGGGMALTLSAVALSGDAIVHNTATLSPTVIGLGGGLWISDHVSLTMTNSLVAGNQANTQGSGLWIAGGDSGTSTGLMIHATIADNGSALHRADGGGQGVYADDDATLALTNTIIAGHPDTGILITTSSVATLEATLWHDNGTDTGGGGTLVTGTVNVYGDPAFVDPAALDYHLGSASAALDRGVDAGVQSDIDRQPRPYQAPDLGADEYWPPGALRHVYLPLVLKGLEQVPVRDARFR